MKKHSIFLLLALAANNALSIGNPFSSQQTDSCPIPQMVEINELNMVGPHPKKLAVIFKNLKERKKIRNNQILIFGPSGTGKSKFAQEIAKAADCNFIEISGSNFTDGHSGIERLNNVFAQAKNGGPLVPNFDNSKPTVISIEEAHAISNQYKEATENLAITLWTSLDRIEGSNVFVFLSTNYREQLHPQLIRRLASNEIKTELPDETARYNLFKFYLADFPELEDHFEAFVNTSAGASHAHIVKACGAAITSGNVSPEAVLLKIATTINSPSAWESIQHYATEYPGLTKVAGGTTTTIVYYLIKKYLGG